LKIHTVKAGDTIFKIAREHGISPMKIIEDNALEYPDRLSVGQQLLILMPTRTYTVRGGDTLKKIADRFNVTKEELITRNPSLLGTEKIYPSQVLSLRYDTPPYALLGANGYYYKGTGESRLRAVLPYLTYITVGLCKRYRKDIHTAFDDTELIKMLREEKKCILMRVLDAGEAKLDEEIANSIVTLAKERGYNGVTLAAYRAQKEEREEYRTFVSLIKEKLNNEGMILFLEIDANDTSVCDVAADGYVLMYERCCLQNPCKIDGAEGRVMKEYHDAGLNHRCFIELSPYAYADREPMTKREAEKLAYNAALEIKNNKDYGISTFEYNRYKKGKREVVRVVYESLENIKAKLELVGELGFMGVTFDIMNVPTEYLMMLECMFKKPSFTPYCDM